MLERDGRRVERDAHREAPHLGRGGPLERLRGLGNNNRERDDDRPGERIREGERDAVAVAGDRVMVRDAEREESLRELVSSYKSALAELTFNSKPIITNLTIIAGENSHAAKGISSTVCNHIMEVPKEQKLPSLYLLDSIVKNIGGEYIKYFAARLPEVFCLAYRQVDPSTNPAMQHLFRTWRGVFPPGPLRLIEEELQISSSAPNGPSGSTHPARPVESPVPRAGHESPIPRTGHGIHVNPKYLEAQRQRLQQSGQAENAPPESNGSVVVRGTEGPNPREGSKGWPDNQLKRPVPPRGKRDEFMDPDFGREAQLDFEYDDYGRSNGPSNQRKPAPARTMERDEGWEPGFFRDGDGEGFAHEEGRNPRSRYGPRNGYDWRQPASRSTDIDGYGYNRGPGPGRGGPFRPGQATAGGLDAKGRGGGVDNWLKADEEEYVWEDMSPRLRPPLIRDGQRTGDGLPKDDWYPSESDRANLSSGGGRLKRTSQDAGFADNSGWQRSGPGGQPDQLRPAIDRRLPKEYEERRGMQPAVGRELGLAGLDQTPGGPRAPIPGLRTHSGWPPQGHGVRNLSPPARSRPGPLQLTLPSGAISPTARSSANLLPRTGTPPTPSNGAGTLQSGGHFELRQPVRPNVGAFGGGSPSYNSLSPVTPASGLPFQHRQQSHRRPPSPTQLAALRPHHHQFPAQAHPHLQHEQSSHLHLGRHHQLQGSAHQLQVSAQLQSSQALPPALQAQPLQQVPLPLGGSSLLQSGQQSLQQAQNLQPGSQIPALQQSQQLTGLQQAQVPVHQQQQQLHQSQSQGQLQPQLHQLPGPLLPLISSQLAQSLQQLAQQAQQSQTLAPQQQPQTSQPLGMQTSQALGLLTQALAPVANGASGAVVQTSESQSSTSNLLAALLQSGLVPPQGSQILPQSQSASAVVSSTPLQPSSIPSGFQGQPPLPSGPPPTQFSMGTASTVQVGVPGQLNSAVATSLGHMTGFTGQAPRFSQPPLPPGPPPASTIVGSAATSQAAPSGGVLSSSISSLLSSLVAHGVIAPLQKPAVAAVSSASPAIVAVQPAANAGFVPVAALPSTSANVPGTTITAVQVSAVMTSVTPPRATTQDTPSSPPRKVKKEAIRTEFKQELLRERHEYVLEALYSDFPRQCKTCGLRFKAQDEHSKHMDWHVSRNRRQKSQKKTSRKWFVSAKEWLSGTAAAASESAPSFFAEEPGVQEENSELVAVPADENQSTCALCGELFEDFYSDETEEWMYKGAVYLNVPQGGSVEGLDTSALGPIVHVKCKTESTETAAVDSAEDDDEVQPELQAADSVRMEVDGMGEDDIMPLLTDNFDMAEVKEEQEDLGSRRKRTRY